MLNVSSTHVCVWSLSPFTSPSDAVMESSKLFRGALELEVELEMELELELRFFCLLCGILSLEAMRHKFLNQNN